VDAKGHAVAAWNGSAAIYDGGWGSTATLGGEVSPTYGSTGRSQLDGAGSTIAVPTAVQGHDMAPDRLVVHRAAPTPDGFRFVEEKELQASSTGTDGNRVDPQLIDLTVEPGGRVLTLFTLFPKVYVRAYEDPAGGPAPPGDDVVKDTGDPGAGKQDTTVAPAQPAAPTLPSPVGPDGPARFILPIRPVELVRVGQLDPARPTATVTCPATAPESCRVRMTLRLDFGATSARAAQRRATVLGSARSTVRPGQRRRIAIKLNRAGRRVVRRRKAVRVRLLTTISVGTQTGTATSRTRIKARRR
jgi:hypothetical protein